MSFSSTTTAPLSEYPSSSLRFGLMDLKPVIVVETVKRFGMKFKQFTRRFESKGQPKDYSELVTFQNEAIFNKITVPSWFDSKELVNVFSQSSIEDYEKDEELKEVIETMKNSNRRERPFTSFVEFMTERFDAKKEEFLAVEAKAFLNSNLPLTFYSKIIVNINTYYEFLRVIEHIVRMSESKACVARSHQLYERHINHMKKELSPILDQMDDITFSLGCLKKFITIWNSKDYDEVLKFPFFDINNLDQEGFKNITCEYNSKLNESRIFLLTNNPYVFQRSETSDPQTSKMFSQFLDFPTETFEL